jgi:hypothetical protein
MEAIAMRCVFVLLISVWSGMVAAAQMQGAGQMPGMPTILFMKSRSGFMG